MATLLMANNILPDSDHVFAWESLSFEVDDSSIITIVGPESSGKKLWLKSLLGINPLKQGDVHLLDYSIRDMDRFTWLNLQKNVSYIDKDTALLSAYTLLENILLPALYHDLGSRKEMTNKIYRLLDEIGFDDRELLNQLPAFVPRLLVYYTKLIRALIVSPRLLCVADLYDGLSAGHAFNIKEFIKSKIKNEGLSLILATPRIDQVIDDFNKMIFISNTHTSVFTGRAELAACNNKALVEYLNQYGVH